MQKNNVPLAPTHYPSACKNYELIVKVQPDARNIPDFYDVDLFIHPKTPTAKKQLDLAYSALPGATQLPWNDHDEAMIFGVRANSANHFYATAKPVFDGWNKNLGINFTWALARIHGEYDPLTKQSNAQALQQKSASSTPRR